MCLNVWRVIWPAPIPTVPVSSLFALAFTLLATVETAVKAFQELHGIKATGTVDKVTLAALNVPASPEQIITSVGATHALANPLGDSPPLHALLTPGMKLTIAFDDISLPLPPMQRPDIRQRVIEAVLDIAAEVGVDDVHLIAALALHRRMTEAELRHAVGDRVYDAFAPQGLLYNHDAEDPDGMAFIGETAAEKIAEREKRQGETDQRGPDEGRAAKKRREETACGELDSDRGKAAGKHQYAEQRRAVADGRPAVLRRCDRTDRRDLSFVVAAARPAVGDG